MRLRNKILNPEETERTKSRRPQNTNFRQQRLKGWEPVVTTKSVLPLFFCIVCVFVPLGSLILYAGYKPSSLSINYTNCDSAYTDSFTKIPSKYTSIHFPGNDDINDYPQWKLILNTDSSAICSLRFHIPTNISRPIYLFYKLTNFYQNHRKYILSYDWDQIKGKAVNSNSLSDDCNPLKIDNDTGKIIYPCGLIPNSLFNDTFSNLLKINPITKDYIENEKSFNFIQNGTSSFSKNIFKKTNYNIDDIVPPPNWKKQFPNGYNESNLPDLSEWDLFQNWLNTAGLSSFSKLYGKNTNKNDILINGYYEMNISMNYPVEVFKGKKFMILETKTVIGGRNVSLGFSYLIVGIVCGALGFLFLIRYWLIRLRGKGTSKKDMLEHRYLKFGKSTDRDIL